MNMIALAAGHPAKTVAFAFSPINIAEAGLKIAVIIILALLAVKTLSFLTIRLVNIIENQSAFQGERLSLRTKTLSNIINNLVAILVIVTATIMVLGELGINVGALIAGAGVVGLALSFGAQSLVKDFITGFFILLEDQYGFGDVVKIGQYTGTVEAMNLRITTLRDISGNVHIIPNGEIKEVTVMTKSWSKALVDIRLQYTQDVNNAMSVLEQVANDLAKDLQDLIIEDPEVLGINALDVYGVTLRVIIKTKPAQQWVVERELRKRILNTFNENKIEFSYIPNSKEQS